VSALVEFVATALDEQEQAARAAAEIWAEPWELRHREVPLPRCRCLSCYEVDPDSAEVWPVEDFEGEIIYFKTPVAAHMAAHDPAQVLRTVAAHRRVLDAYVKASKALSGRRRVVRWSKADVATAGATCDALEVAVRAIAGIFAGRDGYDPAWAANEIEEDGQT